MVLFDAERDAGAVSSRRMDGQILTFDAEPGAGGTVARDAEAGTRGDVTGAGHEGGLGGPALAPIAHYNKPFRFS